jgi:fatty acid desaturase
MIQMNPLDNGNNFFLNMNVLRFSFISKCQLKMKLKTCLSTLHQKLLSLRYSGFGATMASSSSNEKKSFYININHLIFFPYRALGWIYAKNRYISWDEILIFLPPTLMFAFGDSTLTFANILSIIVVWNMILYFSSLFYIKVMNESNHHRFPKFPEGHEINNMDFGVYQISTATNVASSDKNIVTAVAYYGYHIIHHMFPSLDLALLPQLKNIFIETCNEFNLSGKFIDKF